MKEKITLGNELLKKGKFLKAKEIFLHLKEETDDPTSLRIINNRLKETNEKIKQCQHSLNLTHYILDDLLVCQLNVSFKHPYTQELIQTLFRDYHKKNYSETSSVMISFEGNGAKIVIKGYDVDMRCQFCKNFIQKIIDNIGQDDVLVKGDCFWET